MYFTSLSSLKVCDKTELEMAAKMPVNVKLGELIMKKKDYSSSKGLLVNLFK